MLDIFCCRLLGWICVHSVSVRVKPLRSNSRCFSENRAKSQTDRKQHYRIIAAIFNHSIEFDGLDNASIVWHAVGRWSSVCYETTPTQILLTSESLTWRSITLFIHLVCVCWLHSNPYFNNCWPRLSFFVQNIESVFFFSWIFPFESW